MVPDLKILLGGETIATLVAEWWKIIKRYPAAAQLGIDANINDLWLYVYPVISSPDKAILEQLRIKYKRLIQQREKPKETRNGAGIVSQENGYGPDPGPGPGSENLISEIYNYINNNIVIVAIGIATFIYLWRK